MGRLRAGAFRVRILFVPMGCERLPSVSDVSNILPKRATESFGSDSRGSARKLFPCCTPHHGSFRLKNQFQFALTDLILRCQPLRGPRLFAERQKQAVPSLELAFDRNLRNAQVHEDFIWALRRA